MDKYDKDLLEKYWNSEYEEKLNAVLENNTELRELFEKHPEKKNLYKLKILDSSVLEKPKKSISKYEQCKDCSFRYIRKDNTFIDNYTADICSIYQQIKPVEVMMNTELCEYYEKEKKKK